MATSVLTIICHIDEGATTVRDRYLSRGSDQSRQQVDLLQNLLAAVQSGSISGRVLTHLENNGGTKTVKTVACTQLNAAGDTVTVNGIVLTEGVDFARGASDTTCATALRDAIEAHKLLNGVLDATSSAGNVTVTCKVPCAAGDAFTITTSDATAFGITATTPGANGTVTRSLRSHAFGKRET